MTDLERVVTSHLKNVQLPSPENNNLYSGYVDGNDGYELFITSLSAIGLSFSTRTSMGDSRTKGRIFFKKNAFTKSPYEISIPFFGSPFQVVRSVHLRCIQGERYFKPRAADNDKQEADVPPNKRQRSTTLSKKFGCPAFLSMKCIRVYNESQYLLAERNTHALSKVSDLLHENLCKKSPAPTSILRFMIILSSADTHTHPISCTSVHFQLHPKLKAEIKKLVLENVTTVKDVKARLAGSVESMCNEAKLPRPDPENKCFYPSDKMVRNHIQLALYDIKKSRFDEKDLENCLIMWKKKYPGDNFFFRSYKSQVTDDNVETAFSLPQIEGNQSTVLFCHQTKWQRHLLKRYGNDISLLDPAFKTVKYSVPLYFIVVKTNCGYSIVGTFIVHEDTSVMISEALSVFVAWNLEWKPKYFMTDFTQSEANAVKEHFPQTAIYLCPFHRDLAWHRWLQMDGHIPSGEDQNIKRLWRDVATSISEEEYNANLDLMNKNETYKQCSLAKAYFAQKWLVCREKWVMAYQANEFLSTLNINNGSETQKKILKHSFLRFSSNKTVPGVLRSIIDEFLPESIKNYSVSNAKVDTTLTLSGNELPAFLRNKILVFINHVRLESNKAVKEYNLDKIIDMSGSDVGTGTGGLFYVQSETEECYYIVDFQAGSCSCSHFTKWQFPCKHMCALFRFTEWTFDKLPSNYVSSPYITVDGDYSAGTVKIEDVITADTQHPSGHIKLDDSITVFTRIEEPPPPQPVTEGLQLINNGGGIPLDSMDDRSVPVVDVPHSLVPDVSFPLICADLDEAREKLKILSSYTYLMDVTSDIAKQFCEKVNQLEIETLTTLKEFDSFLDLQPCTNSINGDNPQQDLLPTSCIDSSGNISNTAMLTAVPLVLNNNLQSTFCDLNTSLQGGEEMQSYTVLDMAV